MRSSLIKTNVLIQKVWDRPQESTVKSFPAACEAARPAPSHGVVFETVWPENIKKEVIRYNNECQISLQNILNKINLNFIQLMCFKNNGFKSKFSNQTHLNSLGQRT